MAQLPPMGSNALSGLLALTGTSILGGNGSGGGSIQELLGKSTPGFGFLHSFFSRWFKIDLTSIAVALAIFGTISGAVRELHGVASKAYWWITRFFTASISIASQDRLNREVINWLGANILTRQNTRILTACSEVIQSDAWYYRKVSYERNDLHHEKRVPVEYLPTFGTTWFFHDGNLFMVRRVPNHNARSSALATGVPDEYADAPQGDEPLVVMCLGRSVKPIKRFLDDCRTFSDKQREAYITVRTSKDPYHRESWDTTILRPMRPLETVHFDEDVKAELVKEITTYLKPQTRRFYTSRGIPYRRGYLLHGPPGTGKTSLSLALSGHFGLDLYIMHIPGIREDSEMERLFTSLPPRCIVLLEDIDAVGIKRKPMVDDDEDDDEDDDDDDEEKSYSRSCRCSLSGLLNVIDGVASQEGRIVLMTSNFAEKLDPALVRPGRIDRKIFLGNISRRSAELMFLRMYGPELDDKVANPHANEAVVSEEELGKFAAQFSEAIPEDTFSPAQLQGYLLNHREDPAEAAAGVGEWAGMEIGRMNETKELAKKAKERRRRKKKAKLLAKMAEANVAAVDATKTQDKDEGSSKETEETKEAEETESDATDKKVSPTTDETSPQVSGNSKAGGDSVVNDVKDSTETANTNEKKDVMANGTGDLTSDEGDAVKGTN